MNGGALPAATREGAASLQVAIAAALNTDDRQSAAGKLVDAFVLQSNASVAQALTDVRGLLDVTRDDGPLGGLRRELISGFAGPLQRVGEQMAEVHTVMVQRRERSTTPADGLEFEVLVGELLNEAATACGDIVTATGSDTGIGSAKVGDFVVEVTGGSGRSARFVVEAKDSALGPKAVRDQLRDAAENRDAVAAVLVVAAPDQGWKKQPLQRVAANQYVVVAERDDMTQVALRVAYQMARVDVLASLVDDDDDVSIDLAALRSKLEQARGLLGTTSTIKSSLTTAVKSIEKARADLETMQSGVAELLSDIEADTRAVIDMEGTND